VSALSPPAPLSPLLLPLSLPLRSPLSPFVTSTNCHHCHHCIVPNAATVTTGTADVYAEKQ
jgi:hypothetical protein